MSELTPETAAFHAVMRAYRPTPYQSATHEAGHALAYIATGTPFQRVRLVPEALKGDLHGAVYSLAAAKVPAWTRAVLLFAGGFAERTWRSSELDMAKIMDINRAWARDRSPGSPAAAAKALVYAHWDTLDAMANLLTAETEVGPRRLFEAVPALIDLLETIQPGRFR